MAGLGLRHGINANQLRRWMLVDHKLDQGGPGGVALLAVNVEDRQVLPLVRYNATQGTLFVNLAGFSVRTPLDIASIAERIVRQVEAVGHKVSAVVDYSDFRVLPDLEDDYWRMVKDVAERFHSSTTRYATQAFLRTRLGAVQGQHGMSSEVLEPTGR